MQIPLTEFEQYIEEKILARGLNYFEKGFVKDFSNQQGKILATVEGTVNYSVHKQDCYKILKENIDAEERRNYDHRST